MIRLLPLLLLTASLFPAERSFVIEVPEHYCRPALIVVLHGHGSYGAEAIGLIGKQPNTIVVAPDGIGRSWNACDCCGVSHETQVDDVGFIGGLIEGTIQRYGVDRNKVFIVGFSNGGMMAHRLAGSLDSIAAFVDVSGTVGGKDNADAQTVLPERPRIEISAMMIHGMLDSVVPFNQDWSLPAERYDLPFAVGVAFWREALGYEVEVLSTSTAEYEINYYIPRDIDPTAPRELVSIAFTAGGHDCTMWAFVKDKILLFFERHPKFMGGSK